jgi:ribosomal protein S18 acetylase RimI-like enzyme
MDSSIQIRPADYNDAAALARVRVESWRTTYRGLLPDEYLSGLSYERNLLNWQNILAANGRQGFAFVAVEEPPGANAGNATPPGEGTIVGFILGGPERTGSRQYPGEVYALYLLANYQRKGLGRRLLAVEASRLLAEGMAAMLIWVLEGNPAQAFYAALGGRRLGEKETVIGSGRYREVSYAWDDIRPLAARDQENA